MTVTTTVSSRQQAALVQVDRADADDVVAVDELALGVDGQDAVGVAVEGQAEVGAPLRHRLLQVAGIGRAAPGVDVGAVGLRVQHRDLGAERLEHERRGGARRAVGVSMTTRRPSSRRPSSMSWLRWST